MSDDDSFRLFTEEQAHAIIFWIALLATMIWWPGS